jgi:hypothetical protein
MLPKAVMSLLCFIPVTDTPWAACLPLPDGSLSKAAAAAGVISKSLPSAGSGTRGLVAFQPFRWVRVLKVKGIILETQFINAISPSTRLPSDKAFIAFAL